MKTVLLVPGYPEDITTRDYKALMNGIEDMGYKVVFVPIKWKRRTITDWVAELDAVYTNYSTTDTILAGFSYGAMTALVSASKKVPNELWLFSLSPYFSEDIPLLKLAWLRRIGKQRSERFWRLSFNELYPLVDCPIKLFIGELELSKWPPMENRFKAASKKFKNCEASVIPDVGHAVDDPKYIRAIQNCI